MMSETKFLTISDFDDRQFILNDEFVIDDLGDDLGDDNYEFNNLDYKITDDRLFYLINKIHFNTDNIVKFKDLSFDINLIVYKYLLSLDIYYDDNKKFYFYILKTLHHKYSNILIKIIISKYSHDYSNLKLENLRNNHIFNQNLIINLQKSLFKSYDLVNQLFINGQLPDLLIAVYQFSSYKNFGIIKNLLESHHFNIDIVNIIENKLNK